MDKYVQEALIEATLDVSSIKSSYGENCDLTTKKVCSRKCSCFDCPDWPDNLTRKEVNKVNELEQKATARIVAAAIAVCLSNDCKVTLGSALDHNIEICITGSAQMVKAVFDKVPDSAKPYLWPACPPRRDCVHIYVPRSVLALIFQRMAELPLSRIS